MSVTIYDIAKVVNTSAVTVSLALRDNTRISEPTRQRVKKAAERLGYQPNPLARGLSGAKTKTIAFVFNFPSEHFAHDLSYTELFHTISMVVSKSDYKLFVHSSTYAKPVLDVYTDIKPYGVDGLILGTSLANPEDREDLKKAPIPTVLLSRNFAAKRVSSLLYGDEQGAYSAVEQLISLGHKRIAFAGRRKTSETSMRRFDGYKKAIESHSIKLRPEMIFDAFWDVESGELVGEKIGKLKQLPTAVLATTDLMAIGIISGLKECGLNVPQDISVIGFDNLHLSRYSIPSLTSVDLRRDLVAQSAIETIVDMIEHNKSGTVIKIPSSLAMRSSVRDIKHEQGQTEVNVSQKELFAKV